MSALAPKADPGWLERAVKVHGYRLHDYHPQPAADDGHAGSDVEEACAGRLRARCFQAEPHKRRGGYTHRDANGQAQTTWRAATYALSGQRVIHSYCIAPCAGSYYR